MTKIKQASEVVEELRQLGEARAAIRRGDMRVVTGQFTPKQLGLEDAFVDGLGRIWMWSADGLALVHFIKTVGGAALQPGSGE